MPALTEPKDLEHAWILLAGAGILLSVVLGAGVHFYLRDEKNKDKNNELITQAIEDIDERLIKAEKDIVRLGTEHDRCRNCRI